MQSNEKKNGIAYNNLIKLGINAFYYSEFTHMARNKLQSEFIKKYIIKTELVLFAKTCNIRHS